MQVRTAILTGITGIVMTLGVGDAAFAQSADRYRDRYEDRYSDQSEYRDRSDSRYERSGRSSRSWRAEQIVRQAYRDILRREPDRSGLRQYTNAMLRDDWSERDVRRSLQRSDEYAQKFGRGRGRSNR
jgi:hypothetical protein